MRNWILSSFLLLVVISEAMCAPQDITSLLMNKPYVEKQINCALDRGPCDVIGKQIRGLLVKVVTDDCKDCTPRQQEQARDITEFMQQYYPHEWSLVVKHYRDPHFQNNP